LGIGKTYSEGKVLTLRVITAVKDDLSGLKRTEHSIRRQSKKVSWILVTPRDASDTYLYAQSLHDSEIVSQIISDKHHGVYAAMNQAITITKDEDWLWFLNAGDEFANTNTYQLVDCFTQNSSNNWVFGGHYLGSETGKILGEIKAPLKFQPMNQLFAKEYVCHQSSIFRAGLLKDLNGFDLSFRIAADFDLMVRASKLDPGLAINEAISVFYLGGLSTKARQQANLELLQLRNKHLSRRIIGKSYAFFLYRLFRNFILLRLEHRAPDFVNVVRKFRFRFR
jgi:GT2 family glycosyltransferase